MARVKSGVVTRRRKKKIFKRAKGFWGGKKNLYKKSAESVDRALQYAYRDRRAKKRDFRSLWILRIGSATRLQGVSYSKFMKGLKNANININRKILSQLAVDDSDAFNQLVKLVT